MNANKEKEAAVSLERARTMLSYDSESGVVSWAVRPGRKMKIGQRAGYRKKDKGYRYIVIDGLAFFEHRLCWFLFYGVWPNDEIDHINHMRDDNRISNLRECSRSENEQNSRMRKNNTSGYQGVTWSHREQKWSAQIYKNYKRIQLGMHNSPEKAYAAYCAAKADLHEFHPHAPLPKAPKSTRKPDQFLTLVKG